jgi:60 kDa SS-A/Ro ribonucleoprotein
MPMTAMIRNLATLTRVGLLTEYSTGTEHVLTQLADTTRLRKAKVHPMALLIALKTYASGHGMRGSGTWTPVKSVCKALDAAFYQAFEAVEPTGKRYLLGVDVSGSMTMGSVAGSPLMPCEAAAAMAMVTKSCEQDVTTMGFADSFRPLAYAKGMKLEKALALTRGMAFGRTDCALPMLFASENNLPVDVFVVYTDNETWFGNVHPAQALKMYRQKMGIDAKLIVVGLTSTQFSIADPKDAGMLDVVGFDASAPAAMNQFVLSESKEGP